MSEEKSSPIGIIVVVAVIAVVAGIFLFKGGSNNGDQNAGNQQQSANGSDTNKTAPQLEPAELKEPAFVKEGLVAYYPFNGNAKDESGNGNDGEVKGAILATDRHGEDRKAYEFDGESNRIEIKPFVSQKFSSITFSAWINTSDERPTKHIFSNYKEGDASAHWFHVLLAEGGPAGHISIQADDGRQDRVPPFLVANKSTSDEQWHQIVATWDSIDGKLSIYLDGEQDDSRDIGIKTSLNLKYPIWIGGQNIRSKRYFKGSIDDVRIYNRALSEEQVKALYDLEKPKK
jgi:hypothetical protein